jgi:hypothetical protein
MIDPVIVQNLSKMEDWQITEVADQCAELYELGGSFAVLSLMVAEAYREIIRQRCAIREMVAVVQTEVTEAEADLPTGPIDDEFFKWGE